MRQIPKLKLNLSKPETFGNLAEKLDVDVRRSLATDLIELIKIDETSMGDWAGKAQGYLDEVDADTAKTATKNAEQQGSNEGPPPSTEMTLSAVVQFAARASDALLGEPDLAKSCEPGGEKLASWVSSELRTNDKNWILDTDPLIVHMAVTGLSWRKRAFDDDDRAFHTAFLTCLEVIINKSVRGDGQRAPRITHQFERYPYEIERSIERGRWVDYKPQYNDRDPQAPKKFYECDLWLDLDDDGIDEPWTITISRDDMVEVVKIAPRWSAKTVINTKEELVFNAIRRFYPYRFLPDPSGGFFPMGFGKLLSRVEGSADRLLASIIDTAETESENGGVLAGGGYGLPDVIEVKGNRIQTLPTDGAPLANRFAAFPTKSVSSGSVAVLEKVMTLGDRLSGTLNMLENAPASMTATLARGIIDTGSQVQSAVHRRVVASLTQELRMFVLMADAYDVLPEGVSISDGGGVAVTADPQLATEMHRSALGGMYMQMIETGASAPGTFNVQECVVRFATVMRLPDPGKLVAPPVQPQASPHEKMQGAIGLLKTKTEHIKTIGTVAVNLTQALKNLVDANGGMINNQTGLLQMAQLEQAVQQLMQEAQNVGNAADGMASQSPNPAAPALPAPAAGGDPAGVPGGQPGGADGPGASGGAA